MTYIPNVPNVHVIGKGFQGEDHYGIKNKNITASFSYENHDPPLKEEDMEKGNPVSSSDLVALITHAIHG